MRTTARIEMGEPRSALEPTAASIARACRQPDGRRISPVAAAGKAVLSRRARSGSAGAVRPTRTRSLAGSRAHQPGAPAPRATSSSAPRGRFCPAAWRDSRAAAAAAAAGQSLRRRQAAIRPIHASRRSSSRATVANPARQSGSPWRSMTVASASVIDGSSGARRSARSRKRRACSRSPASARRPPVSSAARASAAARAALLRTASAAEPAGLDKLESLRIGIGRRSMDAGPVRSRQTGRRGRGAAEIALPAGFGQDTARWRCAGCSRKGDSGWTRSRRW